jgi:hypothetical protein
MKIAWVDYTFNPRNRSFVDRQFAEEMKQKGLELDVRRTIGEFGELKGYQGIIMHPGVRRQKDIFTTQERFPHLPLAVISDIPDDYENEDEIPVFGYRSIERIAKFFKKINFGKEYGK